jgi:hypothetical protein
MSLRIYRTNRWAWCAFSVGVFLALGLAIRFDIKGETFSLARLLLANASDLWSGRGDAAAAVFITLGLAIWIIIAAGVGWILQSVAVIFISRKREKSKPSA